LDGLFVDGSSAGTMRGRGERHGEGREGRRRPNSSRRPQSAASTKSAPAATRSMDAASVPGVFYRTQWDGSYRRHGRPVQSINRPASAAHDPPRAERCDRSRKKSAQRRPASGSRSRQRSSVKSKPKTSAYGVWNPPRFSDLA
jgi:hypothetical protein